MFKLAQKKKEEQDKREQEAKHGYSKQMSIRSKLLTQEVAELQPELPKTCSVTFGDVDDLRMFTLTIKPSEGYWKGGSFVFEITIPKEYNIKPPVAACKTRLWHPNITEDGKICLSLLREHTMDGTGWLPTRTLLDVVWGLNSLFTDLVNFDDPLNTDAAEQFRVNPDSFERKAKDYVKRYAS
ncbi:NEDD8-conjugating enzyme UBE2F-like [Dysidea avara]|uniref:NEDD8-conjugating enzyme UBE2F-like n=1 Tax=Dysidea avara TaxID=196820 RepID=UPI003329F183